MHQSKPNWVAPQVRSFADEEAIREHFKGRLTSEDEALLEQFLWEARQASQPKRKRA